MDRLGHDLQLRLARGQRIAEPCHHARQQVVDLLGPGQLRLGARDHHLIDQRRHIGEARALAGHP